MCDFPPKYTFLSVMPSKREDALLWYQDPGNSSANHDNHTNTKYPPQIADSRLVLLYKKWTWIFFKRTTLPLPNQSKTSSTDGRIEVWKIYPLSYLEIELQKLTRHWCWVEPLPRAGWGVLLLLQGWHVILPRKYMKPKVYQPLYWIQYNSPMSSNNGKQIDLWRRG